MGWLCPLIAVVLLLGPLRPWVGRHWATLVSAVAGAALGWFAAVLLLAKSGVNIPYLPLLWALGGAAMLGRSGPAWLRRVEKDGKEQGDDPRGH